MLEEDPAVGKLGEDSYVTVRFRVCAFPIERT